MTAADWNPYPALDAKAESHGGPRTHRPPQAVSRDEATAWVTAAAMGHEPVTEALGRAADALRRTGRKP